jgi:hypothetical protein
MTNDHDCTIPQQAKEQLFREQVAANTAEAKRLRARILMLEAKLKAIRLALDAPDLPWIGEMVRGSFPDGIGES